LRLGQARAWVLRATEVLDRPAGPGATLQGIPQELPMRGYRPLLQRQCNTRVFIFSNQYNEQCNAECAGAGSKIADKVMTKTNQHRFQVAKKIGEAMWNNQNGKIGWNLLWAPGLIQI